MKKTMIPMIAGLVIGYVAYYGSPAFALGIIGFLVVKNAILIIDNDDNLDKLRDEIECNRHTSKQFFSPEIGWIQLC